MLYNYLILHSHHDIFYINLGTIIKKKLQLDIEKLVVVAQIV